jgi:hypothetical protein
MMSRQDPESWPGVAVPAARRVRPTVRDRLKKSGVRSPTSGMLKIWSEVFPEIPANPAKEACINLAAALRKKFSGSLERWREYLSLIRTSDYLMGKDFNLDLLRALKFHTIDMVLAGEFGVSRPKDLPIGTREEAEAHIGSLNESEKCLELRRSILDRHGPPIICGLSPHYDLRHFRNPAGSGYSLKETTYLLTNYGAYPFYEGTEVVYPRPPNLRYIMDIEDTELFSSSFVDCLVIWLALQLSKYFVDALQYFQILMAEFTQEMNKAVVNDCRQLSQ